GCSRVGPVVALGAKRSTHCLRDQRCLRRGLADVELLRDPARHLLLALGVRPQKMGTGDAGSIARSTSISARSPSAERRYGSTPLLVLVFHASVEHPSSYSTSSRRARIYGVNFDGRLDRRSLQERRKRPRVVSCANRCWPYFGCRLRGRRQRSSY